MRKVFRISCETKIRENYSIMTPNYGSFKAGDSTHSRFLMWHAPHAIRDVESILSVMLMRDRDSAILCHPMPFFAGSNMVCS